MARIAPPVLRPLPRQVKPFPGETSSSYVARLAHANRLDATALRCYITGNRRAARPYPPSACPSLLVSQRRYCATPSPTLTQPPAGQRASH